MAKHSIADKWRLVRRADIARNLRHLLLVLMHYQNDNATVWCRRELLADELGIKRDVLTQKMKQLEDIGVVERVWRNRNGRPSREYTIRFSTLVNSQRTLSESSECTLRKSSDCDAPTLSESSESPLANPQSQSEGILRDEVTIEVTNEEPSSRQHRFTDADMQTSDFIWELITDMQPERKKPNLQKWANSIRLMRERDGRTDEQIRELFIWCNQDEFWRVNILSPDKMRQKWDDLQLKRGERSGTAKPGDGVKAEFAKLQTLLKRFDWPDDRLNIQSEVSTSAIKAAMATGWDLIKTPNADTFTMFAQKYRELA